jgi:small subunit ribosomal protein S1
MSNQNRDDASNPSQNEDFASLFAEYEKQQGGNKYKRRGPSVGDQVKGRVVSIGADAVFVDLGGKSEGTLSALEVRDDEGRITLKVGDELEARVVSTEDGQILLRRVLGKGKEAHAELLSAFQMNIPVEGLVTGVNKGGVEVQVAGARAFCPISQLDLRHVEDASIYVGQRLQFRITKYEGAGKGRENIVLSRRSLLEAEAAVKAAEIRGTLSVGAVVHGKVTTIKDYGAFIDLGGIEGMLHVSELGFARVGHPRDVLSVGQPVEVQIIKLEKSDDPKRPEKISLSLKSLEKDPWSDAKERFPAGTKLPGKVMRVESFGAFIEIAPGIEGLVHISEMVVVYKGNQQDARRALKPGNSVEVTVLGVDTDKRRISLSMLAKEVEEEIPMAAGRAPAKSLGTFGDLLAKATKQKK